MADRFIHPSGKKSQHITMRNGKIRKTGESPSGEQSTPENIRRKYRMMQEAGDSGESKVGQAGVSGYKTPKSQVKKGLEEAGSEREPTREEEPTPTVGGTIRVGQ